MLKRIEGFPSYLISDDGRVYSETNKRFLKQNDTRCNYPSICLRKDGKNYMFLIHRLVAEAFIPNPDNLPQVNHKDEDKTNCTVSNLEWCYAKYNTNYGDGIKRHIKSQLANGNLGNYNKEYAEKLKKPVIQKTKSGEIVAEYGSLKEAHDITHINNICQCAKGKLNHAGGYVWTYK